MLQKSNTPPPPHTRTGDPATREGLRGAAPPPLSGTLERPPRSLSLPRDNNPAGPQQPPKRRRSRSRVLSPKGDAAVLGRAPLALQVLGGGEEREASGPPFLRPLAASLQKPKAKAKNQPFCSSAGSRSAADRPSWIAAGSNGALHSCGLQASTSGSLCKNGDALPSLLRCCLHLCPLPHSRPSSSPRAASTAFSLSLPPLNEPPSSVDCGFDAAQTNCGSPIGVVLTGPAKTWARKGAGRKGVESKEETGKKKESRGEGGERCRQRENKATE